jgi:SagB-type dehydrogenase family enzyme
MPAVRYRASPHIVAYWESDRLVIHQFAVGNRAAANPVILAILHACRTWRGLDDIVRQSEGLPKQIVRAAVNVLASASFLHRSDRKVERAEAAYATWNGWNPAAGFFHSATRGEHWAAPPEREALMRGLVRKARTASVPAPVKPRGGPSLQLAPVRRDGEFPSVLLARRTWRRFSRRPVAFADLSTLLGLTAGVQMWGTSGAGNVRVPFTTSPSAGSKHPIELYIIARRVAGVAPGVYRYAGDRHRLERISGPVAPRQVERLLGQQWYFKDAAAVVFMTAVWARTQWTYTDARAYRSVLAEAGHVCQTFCLAATWLNLAPFCTMALADSEIEKALRIDGITESVLYAAGVGVKPEDGKWVQWPEHEPGRPSFPRKKKPRRT